MTGNADASVINSTTTMLVGWGCGCGWNPSATGTLTDGQRSVIVNFFIASNSRSFTAYKRQAFLGVKAFGAARPLGATTAGVPMQFQLTPGTHPDTYGPQQFLRLFPAGAQWPGGGAVGSHDPWPKTAFPGVALAQLRVTQTFNPTYYTVNSRGTTSLFPNSVSPVDGYVLFSFSEDISHTYYGWIGLTIEMQPEGPNVTVHGWAYDNTGITLAAGYVPEPSTFTMAGLSALALGAKGIRRWRAARPS